MNVQVIKVKIENEHPDTLVLWVKIDGWIMLSRVWVYFCEVNETIQVLADQEHFWIDNPEKEREFEEKILQQLESNIGVLALLPPGGWSASSKCVENIV